MKARIGTRLMLTHGRQPKRASRIVALLAATALAAGMLSSTPIAAFAGSSTGTISGTVTSTSKVGISGISVMAAGPNHVWAATDTSGNYTLSGLSAGDYRVEFQPSWGQNFVSQYWNDSPGYTSATLIAVASGSTTSNIDAELVEGATISGNVKGTGTPPVNLADVQVIANTDPSAGQDQAISAWTDSNGDFTIIGLAEGEYQLAYDTQQARAFAPEVSDKLVLLSQGEALSGIQATLEAGSKISGFVSAESDPLVGVEGVHVSAESLTPSVAPYYSGPIGTTNPDGEYILEGLPAGTFNLTYWAPEDTDANLLTSSVQLTVSSGGATTQNVILQTGGSVTGNVTAGGAPAEGVGVFIRDGEVWRSAVTNHLGNYILAQLPTGSYPVRFSDPNSSDVDALATEWWPAASTRADATSVPVTAGEVTPGIDADLTQGSSISGQISYELGDLSTTSSLFVWDADGNVFRDDQYLSAARSYVVGGLPAGDYRIGITDKTFGDGIPTGESDIYDEFGNLIGWKFNPGYADDKQSLSTADVITIHGPNEHLEGHDISLTLKTEPNKFSAAPAPIINGIPEVGEVLSVTVLPSDWVPSTFLNFRWFRDGTPISFATNFAMSSSYELQPVDAGHEISVSVTASRIGYEELVRTSAAILIAGGPGFVTAPPTISGTPQVGKTLTATVTPWTPQPSELTFQWLSDGVEIAGATDSAYDISSANLGAKLSVEVTGAKDGYGAASATSEQTAAIAGGHLTTSVPTFAPPDPIVGDTLTAQPGVWGPAPVAFSHQWERDGTDIPGAVSVNYQVVPADLGSRLSVRVVGVKASYVAGIETSASSGTVGKGIIATGTVSITGAPEVGTELTAVPGTWAPENTTLSYVWQANGAPISGATSSTFTPTQSQTTKTLSVVVTGTADGYTTASQTSLGVVIAQEPLEVAIPTITGTPQFGATLTAESGDWGPSGVVLSYQWAVDGADKAGATKGTYTPVVADLGKAVTVKVTGSLDTYLTVTKSSTPTKPVVKATIVAGAPTISGSAVVGSTLTADANASDWAPSSVTLSYQWWANGSAITGATAPTYTVDAADLGKTITVMISGTLTGYTPDSATSAKTSAVANGEIKQSRLSGVNRYETAVAISKQFSGASKAYIATGTGYADALSAGSAAAHFDAPLLLTKPDALPTTVKAELMRLKPAQIVIVGGTGVVSAGVESVLGSLSFHPTVNRVSGADRYATSRALATDTWGAGSLGTAYLATGSNFPDALSAGPAAAHFDGPVILIPGTASSIDAATTALLTKLKVDKIKIAGGTGAVSAAIEAQAKAIVGASDVTRNGAIDRYATSVAVNADEFGSASIVYLATGSGYADALAGSALAGANGAPLFVTHTTCVPAATLSAIRALGATQVVLLGGTGALTAGVERLARCG